LFAPDVAGAVRFVNRTAPWLGAVLIVEVAPLTVLARPQAELHAAFLTILPRIELHGRVYFRHKKPEKRDEAIAEMVALAWKSFINCVRNGKNPLEFPMALARRAAQAVHNGRRLCGQEKIKDVLAPRTQRRHNFTVVSLPEGSSLNGNVFDDALIDNTQTPVPDQVSAIR
jgi:hypothetical protein